MPALDQVEMNAFLEKGWVAKLGTLLDDGSPYVTPVWYEWDGTSFWVIGKPLARFVSNIKRDKRVYLLITTPKRLNTWKVTDFPPDRTFTTQAKWQEL